MDIIPLFPRRSGQWFRFPRVSLQQQLMKLSVSFNARRSANLKLRVWLAAVEQKLRRSAERAIKWDATTPVHAAPVKSTRSATERMRLSSSKNKAPADSDSTAFGKLLNAAILGSARRLRFQGNCCGSMLGFCFYRARHAAVTRQRVYLGNYSQAGSH